MDEEEAAAGAFVDGGIAVAVSIVLAIGSFYLDNYWFNLVLVVGSLVAATVGLVGGLRKRSGVVVLQSGCLIVMDLIMLVSHPM